MTTWRTAILAACLALAGAHAAAQVTLFEHDDFGGRSVQLRGEAADFAGFGFNDRASSLLVQGGMWEVCQDRAFRGTCVVLRPGRYRSLSEINLNDRVSSARPMRGGWQGGHDRHEPRIVFFEHDDFRGARQRSESDRADLASSGFNDRASSIDVVAGDWQVCEHAGFQGRCAVLRPGRYPTLSPYGLNDVVSSARPLPRRHRWDDDGRRREPVMGAAY